MQKHPNPQNGHQLAKILTKNGFTVTKTKKGHYKATHPQHPTKPPLHFPSTPSDHRWAKNALTWLKRTYNITLKP